VTGGTLGVAESLTGGALTARLVDVPGASVVLRGAVVAYATDLKAGILGVPSGLLREHGAVHPAVAAAMAAGAARVLGASWGLATTGVAGPAEQDGQPVGTVHVAVSGPGGRVVSLHLPGGRAQVRAGAAEAALELLLACLAGRPGSAELLAAREAAAPVGR
jgi:nicotinamide-nucleotide amidase